MLNKPHDSDFNPKHTLVSMCVCECECEIYPEMQMTHVKMMHQMQLVHLPVGIIVFMTCFINLQQRSMGSDVALDANHVRV